MPDQPNTLDALMVLLRDSIGDNTGAGEHILRCKEGVAPFRLPVAVTRQKRAEHMPDGDMPDGGDSEKPDDEKMDESGSFIVAGVASSTSVDWYGTEMSADALDYMSQQFNAGVDLFPRHGGFLDTVEWNEVLGRTFASAVQRADVADPADVDESGFILSIQARVEHDAPGAKELERRLDNGQEIGLSIGGWFLEVRYVTDEDGEIIRIIIERALLDHVAVTRGPANPDSTGLKVLRDVGAAVSIRAVEHSAYGVTPEADNQTAYHSDDGSSEPTTITRSAEMPTNENSDNPILALLQEIKAEQTRSAERLDAIEARATAPVEVEAPAAETTIEAIPAEQVQADMARAIADALEARGLGAAPAPVVDPADDPAVAELRAKVASLEAATANRDAALANLVGSGRVGRSSTMAHPVLGGGYDTDQAAADIDGLIGRCRANGDVAPVLCAIVSRHKDAISISREISGHLPKGERGKAYLQAAHNGPAMLRSLLVAAERDGIIGNLDSGWR